jgi:hypothetical protein
MTRKGKFVLAGLAAVAVVGAAAGAMADRGHYWGGAGKGRHHFGNGGIMGLSFGGPNYRVCRGEPGEMTDHMLVRIEHRLKPTDDQKAAFEEFKTAARSAADKLREACPQKPENTADGERQKRTPIERLAFAQTGLETSLEALKQFRPAAEKFYATLSDEQKAKLNRGGGPGGKGKGHWKRDRGPDRGDEPESPAPAPENKG